MTLITLVSIEVKCFHLNLRDNSAYLKLGNSFLFALNIYC